MNNTHTFNTDQCILYEKYISDLVEYEIEVTELNDRALDRDLATASIDIVHRLLRMGEFDDVAEILSSLQAQIRKVKTRQKYQANRAAKRKIGG